MWHQLKDPERFELVIATAKSRLVSGQKISVKKENRRIIGRIRDGCKFFGNQISLPHFGPVREAIQKWTGLGIEDAKKLYQENRAYWIFLIELEQ